MNAESAILMVRNTIRLKHFSLSTEDCYVGWLVRFMRYLVKLPHGLSSERKLEALMA